MYRAKRTALPYFVEGQEIKPLYEDDIEIIIEGQAGSNMNHHIKKSGDYFSEHIEII